MNYCLLAIINYQPAKQNQNNNNHEVITCCCFVVRANQRLLAAVILEATSLMAKSVARSLKIIMLDYLLLSAVYIIILCI
jgi:hypothetical protein